MKKKIVFLVMLAFGLMWAQQANAVIMTFEDQSLSDTFNAGDFFYATGVRIDVEEFQLQGGGSTSGSLSIGNSGTAGGSGKELVVNNVNLNFQFLASGCPSCGLALLFGHFGGEINLGIDGDLYKANNFDDLVGTIPGVQLSVVGTGDVGALIIIKGDNINSFVIGGQELALDNVIACENEVPEPATICLLGFGGLSLIAARKKRS